MWPTKHTLFCTITSTEGGESACTLRSVELLVGHVTYAISTHEYALCSGPEQPPHHNRFTALFLGLPVWAGVRRELLDFMAQGKINKGRHTDHPGGSHSIRTNQCIPPPSRIYYRPDALPAAQPTVSKHWRQLAHSDWGKDARVLLNGVTCTVSGTDEAPKLNQPGESRTSQVSLASSRWVQNPPCESMITPVSLSEGIRSQSTQYTVSQKTSHLWLAIIFTYTVRLRQFLVQMLLRK